MSCLVVRSGRCGRATAILANGARRRNGGRLLGREGPRETFVLAARAEPGRGCSQRRRSTGAFAARGRVRRGGWKDIGALGFLPRHAGRRGRGHDAPNEVIPGDRAHDDHRRARQSPIFVPAHRLAFVDRGTRTGAFACAVDCRLRGDRGSSWAAALVPDHRIPEADTRGRVVDELRAACSDAPYRAAA